jgi:molybdenum cofactor biosynthesis protein B
MSAEEHRTAAGEVSATFAVLVVSTSRRPATDVSGKVIVELATAAGHIVSERRVVPDDPAKVRAAVAELAVAADVIVCTGGTGLSARDATPEALATVWVREIPGFGELFRMLSWGEVGSSAMLSRAVAGLVEGAAVFCIPGSTAACTLAMSRLILPETAHLLREVGKESPLAAEPEASDATTAVTAPAPAVRASPWSLGRLGQGRVVADVNPTPDATAPAAEATEAEATPTAGWLGAVAEIRGELKRGQWPELPPDIERLAPVMNVLDTAGERGVLKLPSGAKLAVYGWPNLEDERAKVLAVGWGSPLGHVIALHRFPVMTGTCISEPHGLLPSRSTDIAQTCLAITGREPADTSGELFAVQGDAVFIQRGNRVARWDGRRERADGNAKQVLSSLVLRWSNR